MSEWGCTNWDVFIKWPDWYNTDETLHYPLMIDSMSMRGILMFWLEAAVIFWTCIYLFKCDWPTFWAHVQYLNINIKKKKSLCFWEGIGLSTDLSETELQ